MFGLSADKDDHIRTECTDWSDELFKSKNYVDELKAALYSKEFSNFLKPN